MVLVALTMVVLMGFSALTLDVGRLYIKKQWLQDAADAAALAGVQLLPGDPQGARTEADRYLELNGFPSPGSGSSGAGAAAVEVNGDTVRVHLTYKVDLYFARVLGLVSAEPVAAAQARVGPVGAVHGAVPLGIWWDQFEYGQVYLLKLASPADEGDVLRGNFHALALGGKGASVYRDNLREGYPGVLRVGDVVSTEPGNMKGPTRQGLLDRLQADPDAVYTAVDSESPRLLFVPVVDGLAAGRDEVEIVGFAAFFLEGINEEDEVQGRFLHWLTDGPVLDREVHADYGLRSVRLVQ